MADGKYPFLEYIEEPDKEKKYKKASDCGWYDPHNNFLIGDICIPQKSGKRGIF